jgi:hypothetical protein
MRTFKHYYIRILQTLLGANFTNQMVGESTLRCTSTPSWTPTWRQITTIPSGSHEWVGVSLSSDGTKLALVDFGVGGGTGGLWTSTDSGVSWTQRAGAGSRAWQSVGISSDGSVIAACWSALGTTGVAYSTDSGATWSTNSVSGSTILDWISVSGDGSTIVTSDGNGGSSGAIYISTNSGATFAARVGAGTRFWDGVKISRDGMTIVGTSRNPGGVVTISADAGSSWTIRTPTSGNWQGVAVSSDGTKIAVSKDDAVYYSANSGISFTSLPPTSIYTAFIIAMSDDGARILAGTDSTNELVLSTDSGMTWAVQDSPGGASWIDVEFSGDGSVGAAITPFELWTLS